MPRIVERALPWLRIDHARVFAFGTSMGGQETLLLVARYPGLLAGAAAFDSVTDMAKRYWQFPGLRCNRRCVRQWTGRLGRQLQTLARLEIGGSPSHYPRSYARRSPIAYARSLARFRVPLQLWWSTADRVVAGRHSVRLLRRIRRLSYDAPVEAHSGKWSHSHEMTARGVLGLALSKFGLITVPAWQATAPPPRVSSR
jgi:pimeloyl-ACP methyl ester carboxylesterase